jgi:hypothetical protein
MRFIKRKIFGFDGPIMGLSWWTVLYLGVLGEVFLKSLGSGVLAVVVLRDFPLGGAQLQRKILLSMMVQKNSKL